MASAVSARLSRAPPSFAPTCPRLRGLRASRGHQSTAAGVGTSIGGTKLPIRPFHAPDSRSAARGHVSVQAVPHVHSRQRLVARVPLVVVETAHKQRQLRAEVNCKSKRQSISQAPQHRSENAPRQLAIWPDYLHDLIEPDIGGLKRPIEYIQAGRAHMWPSPRMRPLCPCHLLLKRETPFGGFDAASGVLGFESGSSIAAQSVNTSEGTIGHQLLFPIGKDGPVGALARRVKCATLTRYRVSAQIERIRRREGEL